MVQTGTEKVLLVHVDLGNVREDQAEFIDLAESAGAEVVGVVTANRARPDIKYFVGKGKAEEIKNQVLATRAELVIVNHDLIPSQERNLEKLLNCRVLDRTGLILDIFAQRARSFEGKLQVELARLEHLSTRLVRGWTHLERQKGGIGLRGGPGETQLELDRRLIQKRIALIKERLEKVRTQREQGRRSRKRTPIQTITLVGYTNAGKSTLFNSITAGDVYVADKLFATLDPTLRSINLSGFGKIIFADTVGFIRHLPHRLVDAFRATLEETKEAGLLLHVVDASDSECEEKIAAVNIVLKEIGAAEVRQLLVYNKIDLLEKKTKPHVDYLENGTPWRVWVSAEGKAGIDILLKELQSILVSGYKEVKINLTPEEGALRAFLYEKGAVKKETVLKNGNWRLVLSLSDELYEKLAKKHNLKI